MYKHLVRINHFKLYFCCWMHKVNIFTGEKLMNLQISNHWLIFLVGIKSDGLKVKRHMYKMRIPRKLLVLWVHTQYKHNQSWHIRLRRMQFISAIFQPDHCLICTLHCNDPEWIFFLIFLALSTTHSVLTDVRALGFSCDATFPEQRLTQKIAFPNKNNSKMST